MVSLFTEIILRDVCFSLLWFIHIYPFHKYLLNTHYMSPIALEAWDMAVNKAKICAFAALNTTPEK